MKQSDLFGDEPRPHPRTDAPKHHLARSSDPPTSHEAAGHAQDSGKIAEDEALVLAAVKLAPGSTAREIEQARGRTGDLHKRFRGLERRGLLREGRARKCQVTGVRSLTWWPVEG